MLPSGSGDPTPTEHPPVVLDALLDAAEQVRWVTVARAGPGGPAEGQVRRHPLVAEAGVPLLEWLSAAEGAGTLWRQESWPEDVSWLWFLPADARPGADALAVMTAVMRGSERVAVVGPKLVQAQASRVVLGVGHRVTRWGRSAESGDVGAYDQGQFDDRADVIGVPLEGMLVRRSVLDEVGGLDPDAHASVRGLDVCWRAHLHGYRVLVAPDAVVALDVASPDGDVAVGAAAQSTMRRRAQARAEVALARAAWWRLPWRGLAMAWCGIWVSLLMLLVRRPRAAGVAWAETAAVLAVGRVFTARRRARGPRIVSERHLASVLEPARAARSAARLMRLDGEDTRTVPPWSVGAVSAMGRNAPATADRSGDSIESGPVSEEFATSPSPRRPERWWSPPFVAAVTMALVVTLVRWWDLRGALDGDGWGVRGPEIQGVSAAASEVWSAWLLGWTGSGLGQGGPGPSWLLPMSGVTWLAARLPGGPAGDQAASVATAWVLGASMVLSVVVAYLAARVAVRSRAVRAATALGWGGLSPLVLAVDSGRLGPVLVHLAAPAVVGGVVLSLRGGRRGTSAACGTALLVAALAWFVPGMVLVGLVTGVIVGAGARGVARVRGLVLTLVPLALLGPHLVQYLADPVLLFGGAGATVAGGEALAGWQALLMHPSGAVGINLWWVVPAWALALVAVITPGGRSAGRLATGLTLAGVGSIAAAVLASRLVLGVLPAGYEEAGLSVTMWPGTFISLGAAAVFLAATVGAGRLLETVAHRGRGTSTGAILLSVAAVAAVAMMGVHAAMTPGQDLEAAPAPLPAVVAERANGPDQVRLLRLTPGEGGPEEEAQEVRYDLEGSEPPAWLRDRTHDLARPPAAIASASAGGEPTGSPGGDPVAAAVSGLVTPLASGAVDPSSTQGPLADLAVGYVSVAAEEDHALVQRIDQAPGLTRVSSAPGTVLWRVLPQAAGSRVQLQSSAGQRGGAVPSAGPHAQSRADIGAGGEVLTVAEPAPWAEVARVQADGATLKPEPGFPVRYPLPSSSQEVEIEVPVEHPRWWLATAALAVVVAVVGTPLPGRRRRGER